MKPLAFLLPIAACVLTGCGAASIPCVSALAVNPPTATVDHAAAAPGNQLQFTEGVQALSGPCGVPQVVVQGPLTSSDTTNVTVSPTGLVTCVNATPKPVTLTPVTSSGKVISGTLMCQ